MYLEHTKSKLGSTNAKVHTGKSESVTRLKRKTGGAIKRTRHATGGGTMSNIYRAVAQMSPNKHAMGGRTDMSNIYRTMINPTVAARKKGGAIKRTRHATGGGTMSNIYRAVAQMSPNKHAMGGMEDTGSNTMMAPAPTYKKGKRVKREHHFLGALLGAASAIPSLINLFRGK